MTEKKRVRFANTAGKPLVTVREINAVGKSHKIKQEPRKFIPADLKKRKARHEAAERRAVSMLTIAENNLNKAKKVAANVQKLQNEAKMKLKKETNPSMIMYTKEKINKLNTLKKNLAPKLENMQITVNIAKNKLKAQRNLGLRRSRFTIL